MYAARTRNGFTPKLRQELMKKFKPLEEKECPFANLPEKKAGRWGAALTAAKMEECRWLKPVLVGQFEFVEWTAAAHLRHSRFIGLRDDKKAIAVRREGAKNTTTVLGSFQARGWLPSVNSLVLTFV
jgi:ATP-dependent DNA ligase